VQEADVLGGPAPAAGSQNGHVHPFVSDSHENAAGGGCDDATYDLGEGGLASSRYAHHSEDLAFTNLEADVVHGLDHAPVDADIPLGQAFRLDYGLSYLCLLPLAKAASHGQELGGHILGIAFRLDLPFIQQYGPVSQLHHDILPVAGDDQGHVEILDGALDRIVHHFGSSRI